MSDTSEAEYELPNLQLEFVDKSSDNIEAKQEETEEIDTFLFPLFADTQKTEKLVQVSLQDKEVPIEQSRPDSYYFQEINDEQRKKFEQSAISYDDIFATNYDNRFKNTEVIDIDEYNLKVENVLKRFKHKQSSRPGLKNRRIRIIAKKNNTLRKQLVKQIAKTINQKKKRGGKKNKKKKTEHTEQTKPKPKYRTE